MRDQFHFRRFRRTPAQYSRFRSWYYWTMECPKCGKRGRVSWWGGSDYFKCQYCTHDQFVITGLACKCEDCKGVAK